MLLCGLECANILCIEKRARCDVPAAEIVRGRARAEDVSYSSSSMTRVDGVAHGIAVLSGKARLYYRRLRSEVEEEPCATVSNSGGDTEPTICPNDTWVVGLQCTTDQCEEFALRCCRFVTEERPAETETEDATAHPEQTDTSE